MSQCNLSMMLVNCSRVDLTRWQIVDAAFFFPFRGINQKNLQFQAIKLLQITITSTAKHQSLKSFDYSSSWLIEKLKSNCSTPTICNNKEARMNQIKTLRLQLVTNAQHVKERKHEISFGKSFNRCTKRSSCLGNAFKVRNAVGGNLWWRRTFKRSFWLTRSSLLC